MGEPTTNFLEQAREEKAQLGSRSMIYSKNWPKGELEVRLSLLDSRGNAARKSWSRHSREIKKGVCSGAALGLLLSRSVFSFWWGGTGERWREV